MTSRLAWVALLVCIAAGCSRVDSPPDAGAPDAGPVDAGLRCGPGQTACNNACTTLELDPANCGACGHACAPREGCALGTCRVDCQTGWTQCQDLCVDVKVNPFNCGACGRACAAGMVCEAGQCKCDPPARLCGSRCADVQNDPKRCGACDRECGAGEVCVAGSCSLSCPPDSLKCNNACVDVRTDSSNCNACGNACTGGRQCRAGACVCPQGLQLCGGLCSNVQVDGANCGSCNNRCPSGTTCAAGICRYNCPPGKVFCSGQCVDVAVDSSNCGTCGTTCFGAGQCSAGACATCSSATTDCDGDGWTVAEGDCCDQPGACGNNPKMVNPGAIELASNNVDDNCNGLVDALDTLDLDACDTPLASTSGNPTEYARALGICRMAQETPATQQEKTWGLLSAALLRADGTPLNYPAARSLRDHFGTTLKPLEGRSMVVLSSGIASDGIQSQPGPNGGPASNVSTDQSNLVNLLTCTAPYCLKDWLGTANPPLKLANQLPAAPNCGTGGFAGPEQAHDSVMLVLRMRAPTNAAAFEFSGYFYSAEYPEFVCTDFNDQMVVLVDTPGGVPAPIANPVDKNLFTYDQGGQRWPVGINVAKGTNIFRVCDPQAAKPFCWDSDVSATSCSLGSASLAGTGFEAVGTASTDCLVGGGTSWLRTSGNVRPGEVVELRIAIWDVGDGILDSLTLLDNFHWLTSAVNPGTTD